VADGRETRAAIDSETVRGLLLINGGGAVALLAFLPVVLQKPELESLAKAIILAVFTFQAGLACAVIHNRFRRLCSFEYAKKERKRCAPFGREWREPCICHWSIGFMWSSIILFLVAGFLVLNAALGVVGVLPQQEETPVVKCPPVVIQAPPNQSLKSGTPQSGAH